MGSNIVQIKFTADLSKLKQELSGLKEASTQAYNKEINAIIKSLAEKEKIVRLKMLKSMDKARELGATNVELRKIEAKYMKGIQKIQEQQLSVMKMGNVQKSKQLEMERKIQNSITRQKEDRAFLSDRIMEGLIAKNKTLAGVSELVSGGFGSAALKVGAIGGALGAVTIAASKFADLVMQGLDSLQMLEKGVASTLSLMSGAEQVQFGEQFAKGIMDIRTATGDSIESLSKGLYDLQSAGQGGADAIKNLELASKAAIAGVTDTATAVDVSTTVMNAFGVTAEETFDTLQQGVIQGKTTLPEIAQYIGTVAGTASSAGVSIQELTGAVSFLTVQGLKTDRAMTSLNSLLTQMKNDVNLQKTLWKDYGISILDAQGNMKNFTEIMGQLGKVKWTDASKGALKLSQESARAFDFLVKSVKKADGTIQTFPDLMKTAFDPNVLKGTMMGSFEAMNSTMEQQSKVLEAQWDKLSQNLAGSFVPVVKFLKDTIGSLLETINSWFMTEAEQVQKVLDTSRAYDEQALKLEELQKKYISLIQSGGDTTGVLKQIEQISPILANNLKMIAQSGDDVTASIDKVNEAFAGTIETQKELSKTTGQIGWIDAIQNLQEFDIQAKGAPQFLSFMKNAEGQVMRLSDAMKNLSEQDIKELESIGGMKIEMFSEKQKSLGLAILDINNRMRGVEELRNKDIIDQSEYLEQIKDLMEDRKTLLIDFAKYEKNIEAAADGVYQSYKDINKAIEEVKMSGISQADQQKIINKLLEKEKDLKKASRDELTKNIEKQTGVKLALETDLSIENAITDAINQQGISEVAKLNNIIAVLEMKKQELKTNKEMLKAGTEALVPYLKIQTSSQALSNLQKLILSEINTGLDKLDASMVTIDKDIEKTKEAIATLKSEMGKPIKPDIYKHPSDKKKGGQKKDVETFKDLKDAFNEFLSDTEIQESKFAKQVQSIYDKSEDYIKQMLERISKAGLDPKAFDKYFKQIRDKADKEANALIKNTESKYDAMLKKELEEREKQLQEMEIIFDKNYPKFETAEAINKELEAITKKAEEQYEIIYGIMKDALDKESKLYKDALDKKTLLDTAYANKKKEIEEQGRNDIKEKYTKLFKDLLDIEENNPAFVTTINNFNKLAQEYKDEISKIQPPVIGKIESEVLIKDQETLNKLKEEENELQLEILEATKQKERFGKETIDTTKKELSNNEKALAILKKGYGNASETWKNVEKIYEEVTKGTMTAEEAMKKYKIITNKQTGATLAWYGIYKDAILSIQKEQEKTVELTKEETKETKTLVEKKQRLAELEEQIANFELKKQKTKMLGAPGVEKEKGIETTFTSAYIEKIKKELIDVYDELKKNIEGVSKVEGFKKVNKELDDTIKALEKAASENKDLFSNKIIQEQINNIKKLKQESEKAQVKLIAEEELKSIEKKIDLNKKDMQIALQNKEIQKGKVLDAEEEAKVKEEFLKKEYSLLKQVEEQLTKIGDKDSEIKDTLISQRTIEIELARVQEEKDKLRFDKLSKMIELAKNELENELLQLENAKDITDKTIERQKILESGNAKIKDLLIQQKDEIQKQIDQDKDSITLLESKKDLTSKELDSLNAFYDKKLQVSNIDNEILELSKQQSEEALKNFDFIEKRISLEEKILDTQLSALTQIEDKEQKELERKRLIKESNEKILELLREQRVQISDQVLQSYLLTENLQNKKNLTEKEREELEKYYDLLGKQQEIEKRITEIKFLGLDEKEKSVDILEKELTLEEKSLENMLDSAANEETRLFIQEESYKRQLNILESMMKQAKIEESMAKNDSERYDSWIKQAEIQGKINSLKIEQEKKEEKSLNLITLYSDNVSKVASSSNNMVTSFKGLNKQVKEGTSDIYDYMNAIDSIGNTVGSVGDSMESIGETLKDSGLQAQAQYVQMASSIITAFTEVSSLMANIFGIETAEDIAKRREEELKRQNELLKNQLDLYEKIYEINKQYDKTLQDLNLAQKDSRKEIQEGLAALADMRDINKELTGQVPIWRENLEKAGLSAEQIKDAMSVLLKQYSNLPIADLMAMGFTEAEVAAIGLYKTTETNLKSINGLQDAGYKLARKKQILETDMAKELSQWQNLRIKGLISEGVYEQRKLETEKRFKYAIEQTDEALQSVTDELSRQTELMNKRYDAQMNLIRINAELTDELKSQTLQKELDLMIARKADTQWLQAQMRGMTLAESAVFFGNLNTDIKAKQLEIEQALREEQEKRIEDQKKAIEEQERARENEIDRIKKDIAYHEKYRQHLIDIEELNTNAEVSEERKLELSRESIQNQINAYNLLKNYYIPGTLEYLEIENSIVNLQQELLLKKKEEIEEQDEINDLQDEYLTLSQKRLQNALAEAELKKGETLTDEERLAISKAFYDEQEKILKNMIAQQELKIQQANNEEDRLEAQIELENLEGQLLDIYLAQLKTKEEMNEETEKENKALKEAYKVLQRIRATGATQGWTMQLRSQEASAQQRILKVAGETGLDENELSRLLNIPKFQEGGLNTSPVGLVGRGEYVLNPRATNTLFSLMDSAFKGINNLPLNQKTDYISTMDQKVNVNFNISGNLDQKTYAQIKKDMPILLNSALKNNGGNGYKKLISSNR